MKPGQGETKFVKEPEEKTRNYIFQKNEKTKIGTYVVVGFLVLLIIGVIISALFFGTPEIPS